MMLSGFPELASSAKKTASGFLLIWTTISYPPLGVICFEFPSFPNSRDPRKPRAKWDLARLTWKMRKIEFLLDNINSINTAWSESKKKKKTLLMHGEKTFKTAQKISAHPLSQCWQCVDFFLSYSLFAFTWKEAQIYMRDKKGGGKCSIPGKAPSFEQANRTPPQSRSTCDGAP